MSFKNHVTTFTTSLLSFCLKKPWVFFGLEMFRPSTFVFTWRGVPEKMIAWKMQVLWVFCEHTCLNAVYQQEEVHVRSRIRQELLASSFVHRLILQWELDSWWKKCLSTASESKNRTCSNRIATCGGFWEGFNSAITRNKNLSQYLFTSFKTPKWLQTKWYTSKDTILWHSFPYPFTWCALICCEC